MSHFKIILETNPIICLCNIYPYQNTLLEYKTNKRVGNEMTLLDAWQGPISIIYLIIVNRMGRAIR
jgi:hypothetical protein